MTREEVMAEIQSNSAFNQARQIFAAESARLHQEDNDPVEMRRQEFLAVEKIAAVLKS